MAYVYMMRCENGALYTGWTNDLQKRVAAHQAGKGAAYTRGFGAASLAWAQVQPDKSAALRREAQIKKLSKQQKEELAAGFDPAAFVVLRPARVQDGDLIQKILKPYVEETTVSFLYQLPSVQDCRAQIRQTAKMLPYFIATDANNRPLGYVCAHPWRYGADAYAWDAETTIYLTQDARRKGLGRMLYNALLAALSLSGYWNAYAVLADPNPDSEAFHDAMGFALEGRQSRTGYKNGWQGISYWCMQLKSGDAAPQKPPAPLSKEQTAALLEAARMGESWQQIVDSFEKAE